MGSSDYSGDDDKSEVLMHPDRVGADPTEGWRRGARGELRKSCDTCTASKTKCCGSIPCDRCKKRNIECKFSKRRRCGPKARAMDDKRPRTGPSDDSDNSCSPPNSRRQPASHYPPVSAIGINGAHDDEMGDGSSMAICGPPPLLAGAHRQMGFNAPLTADGLAGLVELIAPSLSDGGGSGSSASGSCMESSYRPAGAASLPGTNALPQQAQVAGCMSFLAGGTSPPHHGGGGGGGGGGNGGGGGGVVRAAALISCSNMEQKHVAPSTAGISPQKQESLRSSRPLLPSHSAPSPALTLPLRDLPPRAKSASATAAPNQAPFAECSESEYRQDEGGEWTGGQGRGSLQFSGGQQKRSTSRGPLPMSLARRPKAHLRVFMRSMGSVVLLPGAEALREASRLDSVDEEGGGGSPVKNASSASGGRASVRHTHTRNGNACFDPMDETDDDGKLGPQRRTAGGAGGGARARRSGSVGEEDWDEGVVDVLAEACKAEAWAAVAVGALFSGAGDDEAKGYVDRSLQALSRCLDGHLPEVASVMLLLTLFWMHFMDRRKVIRYFGFAQQVGLELGALMPEGLRHSIAFVSVLVAMTITRDQASSLGVEVKDPAAWGVAARNSPGGDPFVRALTAVTVACSRMLQDGGGRGCGGGLKGVNGVLGPALSPSILPSQALTDMLGAAAEAVGAVGSRDSDQVPDQMLALLHGLKGYTHAMRDETDDAEALAKLTLDVVDRHPAVIHLPLTFTLAEASRRLVDATTGRNARAALPPPHVEALRVARAGLVFARPGGEHGVDGVAGKGVSVGQRKVGGWCAFGDEIIASFAKAGIDAGGSSSPQASDQGEPCRPAHSRAGSMSPPPGRVARPLSRAVRQSMEWKPSSAGGVGLASGSDLRNPNGPPSSHASPANRPPNLEPCPSSWRVPSPVSSNRALANVDGTTDWVDRVRTLPTASRSPSPGIVHGVSINRPAPPGERPSSTGVLGPGPMPPSAPNQGGRYASEPVGLTLLSGVAAPGVHVGAPRYASHEVGSKSGRAVGRGRTGRGSSGVGVGSHGGQSGEDGNADDFPPPANPMMGSSMSFDPNREDTEFQEMVFAFPPSN